MRTIKPKSGDLRVYVIVNVPNVPTHYPVKDWQHGKRLIESLSESQLLDESIISNVFGLEAFDGSEWLEWQNEEGGTISEVELTPAEAAERLKK